MPDDALGREPRIGVEQSAQQACQRPILGIRIGRLVATLELDADRIIVALLAPLPRRHAGVPGPAFLVLRNFDAFYSYNAAESYGLAIAHLADRLRGGGPFGTPWPTDDPGLSRAERRELQTLLSARGHDIGAIDGMLGDKTRAAVRAEQQRLGMEPSGRAGQKLLKALRAG